MMGVQQQRTAQPSEKPRCHRRSPPHLTLSR
ncbi:unnamed protein product [Ectocarpus sp. CCAP 1310/34]|nr:unnamed protein product [Ectocarpus sp. CCAP 1310/34]